MYNETGLSVVSLMIEMCVVYRREFNADDKQNNVR